jgi:hypothetical protein
MSESLNAELQHWQARTDDMQVSLDRMREDRDLLRAEKETVERGLCESGARVGDVQADG